MGEGRTPPPDSSVSFREHDIDYLQRRTKIWLEAVLGEKYGDRSLAELIADGNLLYRVSRHLTKEVTGMSPGPHETPPKSWADSPVGKRSGKYLPYANVDTFLKTCKKLGLTDVELFTPPDAVEGRDIRRVCTCIRSLTRKARKNFIRVPDFEDVHRPLPMPKEKVGEIRENLQHSHTSPSTNSPEGDIQKSERVQIISRFLSSTANRSEEFPRDGAASGGSPPATPGQLKGTHSFSSIESPSTPTPTISGVGTPALTKSLSGSEPTSENGKSSKSNLGSMEDVGSLDDHDAEKQSASSDSLAGPDEIATSKSGTAPSKGAISTDNPPEQTEHVSSFSKAYRHLQPHFSFKKSSEEDLSESSALQAPQATSSEKSSQANTPASNSRAATPQASKKGAGTDAESKTPQPETPKSNPSEKRSQANTPASNSRAATPQASEKGAGTDAESKTPQPETPKRTSSRPIRKEQTKPSKDPAKKHDDKVPVVHFSSKLWVPLLAGAVTFLGSLVFMRKRDPSEYEVKQGDTLSKISKELGESSWDELVRLNPRITNPNLIYPSDRLKLPADRIKHFPS